MKSPTWRKQLTTRSPNPKPLVTGSSLPFHRPTGQISSSFSKSHEFLTMMKSGWHIVAGFLLCASFLCFQSAQTWDEGGHLLVAQIANDRLSPALQQKRQAQWPDSSFKIFRGAGTY